MSSQAKDIVGNFYESFYSDATALEKYLHPQVWLCWHSGEGYRELGYNEIAELTQVMAASYADLKLDIADIIEENGKVAIHFTYHGKTIENPEEEMALAHFMATWELKDNKLYKGYQISRMAED